MRKRDIAKSIEQRYSPHKVVGQLHISKYRLKQLKDHLRKNDLVTESAPVSVDPVVSALFGMATVVVTLVAMIDAIDALVRTAALPPSTSKPKSVLRWQSATDHRILREALPPSTLICAITTRHLKGIVFLA